MSIDQLAREIKLLVLDVDGVMTDGGIIYGPDAAEYKRFHVQDGHGLKLLMRTGLEVAIITGRESAAVTARARDLGIQRVYQRALRKEEAYADLLQQTGCVDVRVCAVGDDVTDLPLIRRAGLGCAVANAVPELKQAADYVTGRCGGDGAVREICELLLKAQGTWEQVLARYY